MAQLLSGCPLIFQDGSTKAAEEHLKGKMVLLYFSAEWCGPCKFFTPLLKEFYEDIKAKGVQNFEVILISRDKSVEEQQKYFHEKHGQWAMLALEDPKNKELGDKYDNEDGIPNLKLIRPDGTEVAGKFLQDLYATTGDLYCDICHGDIEDKNALFKCQHCDDYGICQKCRTHLVLRPEHLFEECTKDDPKIRAQRKKKVDKIWAEWVQKYEGNAAGEEEKKCEGGNCRL